MRNLYSALLYLLFPLILLRMLWRSRRAPQYRQRLGERFGLLPADIQPSAPLIWVHAVSVGEVQAAAPLVEGLLQRFDDHQLLVSTTTPTGSQRVRALFGDRVLHVYCPWDMPGAVRRFLRRVRPRLLLLLETELWPNLLHQASAGGCTLVLANARMSQRSARGYARVRPLVRPMLAQLDLAVCQSQQEGERLLELGLPRSALRVTGSLKFDLKIDAAMRASAALLRRDFGTPQRPVLLAASTHAGEEQQILAAFAQLRRSLPGCLLVLAPRHPERFEEVYALAVAGGWVVARRSAGDSPAADLDVLLLDTMGELATLFSIASVAVIGGSLVKHGGHNPLEAAVWGVPVVTGPHMFNFTAIGEALQVAGAMVRLEDPGELTACLERLMHDSSACRNMGAAALRVVDQNRGAVDELLQLVAGQLVDGAESAVTV